MDQTRVQDLCTRGHHSPFHSSLAALTPQSIPPGYWISSLLSYGFQGNAGPTKPLQSKHCPAPPELYDSLTGTISTSIQIRHNMPTSGTVTSLLMRSWLGGQIPPGGGTFRSFHSTSLKLYGASPSQLAHQSHYFRGRPGTSPTPPSSSRTDSPKSLRSQRTVPRGAFDPTSFTDTGYSLIQSYLLHCGQSSPRLLHLSSIMVPLT